MRSLTDQFHSLYYESGVWRNTFWLGVATQKCPLDLWIYQEIIFETQPTLIIETGTAAGGSALFLASICDLVDRGRVVTVDITNNAARPRHPRISYLHGSSVSAEVSQAIKREIAPHDRVMVILDSDHRRTHVLAEVETYAGLVTPGCYLIVEDTNINNHPVAEAFGPGPMEAVADLLRTRSDFVSDRDREKFFVTFNSKGFLRKIG